MDVSANQNKVINDYFSAWLNFNFLLLERIFYKDSKYTIIGKHKYTNLDEIKSYWLHNSIRQKDLQVQWKIIITIKRFSIVRFSARFFDIEEVEKQIVTGYIWFLFKNNKIVSLSEVYKIGRMYEKRVEKASNNYKKRMQ